MNEYNAVGQLIHEERASDGERLDHYLARIRPNLGDQAFWYAECDANRIEVRDKLSPSLGMYNGERWFVRWFDGRRWRVMDLPAGERPRMRNGFCHIVKE
jgi:predicted metal-dependent hydrolase